MNRFDHHCARRYAATAICLLLLQATATRASESEYATPAAIRAAAEAAVNAQARHLGHAISAVAADLDPRLRLHACERPLAAAVGGDGQLHESTTVGVRCDAPVRWTIYVRVTVSSEQDVLVARRPLPRDAVPEVADFEATRQLLPGTGSRYIGAPEQLRGRRLRRPVAAGEVLLVDALVTAPVILRGQQLTLLARAGAMEVRVAAVAMSDGRPEQRISVRNLATQRIVEAVVRSPGVAEVSL